MRIIENEVMKVSVADFGAELCSVLDKETGVERVWDGNPEIWNRHAPILFPFVGKVTGGVYRIGEKEYQMKTQHGFARDMEFECVEASANAVTHRLTATDTTKEIYPFDFELLVTHKLDDENPRVLQVIWEVINHSEETMYYSIGGHPAFTLPVETSEERKEYFLEFPNRDKIDYISINLENAFIEADVVYPLELDNGFVQFFDKIHDTLIFDYQNIEAVRIARPDKTPYVTMTCEQFPMFGIWAKKKGNFICLEPWFGRSDDNGFTGTLEEKSGVEKLEKEGKKVISYTMEFHK